MGGGKGGKGGGKEDDEERRQGKGRTRARARAAESDDKFSAKVEDVKEEKGKDKGKGKGKAKGDFKKGEYGGKDGKDGKDRDKGKGKDGEKGKGKGKDEDKGKGKKGEKGKGRGKDMDGDGGGGFSKGDPSKGMMMQDLEAKMMTQEEKSKPGSSKTNPFEAKGVYCDVKKHSDMGCAVVMMESEAACDAVLEHGKKNLSSKGRPQVKIGDLMVDMRQHPAEEGEARNGIFVAWGRKVEKTTPLPASSIAESFDDLWRDIRGTTNIAGVNAPAVMPSSTPVPVPTAPKAAQPPTPAALTAEQQLFYTQLAMVGQAMQAQAQLANAPGSTSPAGVASTNGPTAAPVAAGKGLPATTGGMRMDAPTFTPMSSQQQQQPQPQQQPQLVQAQQQMQQQLLLHQQQQQLQQLQTQMQQMQQMQQMHEMTQMWYQNTPDNGDASAASGSYFGTQAPAQPERRPLQIKDPKSGETIEAPVVTALDSFEPQAPTRKAMAIVDPSSGKAVDAMQVLGFQPAEPKNPMTITDPKSGDIIKI